MKTKKILKKNGLTTTSSEKVHSLGEAIINLDKARRFMWGKISTERYHKMILESGKSFDELTTAENTAFMVYAGLRMASFVELQRCGAPDYTFEDVSNWTETINEDELKKVKDAIHNSYWYKKMVAEGKGAVENK